MTVKDVIRSLWILKGIVRRWNCFSAANHACRIAACLHGAWARDGVPQLPPPPSQRQHFGRTTGASGACDIHSGEAGLRVDVGRLKAVDGDPLRIPVDADLKCFGVLGQHRVGAPVGILKGGSVGIHAQVDMVGLVEG